MTSTQNRTLDFQELGLMAYEQAFEFQEKLMKEIIDLKLKNRLRTDDVSEETPNYLLFVEHPHVYTIG